MGKGGELENCKSVKASKAVRFQRLLGRILSFSRLCSKELGDEGASCGLNQQIVSQVNFIRGVKRKSEGDIWVDGQY